MMEFDEGLDPEAEQRLWDQARDALRANNEEQSLEALRVLSRDGDRRASMAIGYIFETRGKHDRRNYVVAAHWYSRSLSQEDHPESRLALARYYYFGLGGAWDFKRAFDHLTKFPVGEHPEVILMLAELYRNGLGTSKDIEMANYLYSWLVDHGYPVGYIGLGRLAKAQKRYLAYTTALCRYLRLAISLVWKDRKHPRAIGTGGPRGNYRRDGFVKTHGVSLSHADKGAL